jgi:hypothetical protein
VRARGNTVTRRERRKLDAPAREEDITRNVQGVGAIVAIVGERLNPQAWRSMCGWTGKGILAASPTRWTSRWKAMHLPDGVGVEDGVLKGRCCGPLCVD